MNLDDIKEIINLMTEHGLTEFEKEENGIRISIKRGTTAPVVVHTSTAPVPVPVKGAGAPAAPPPVDDARFVIIKAPFVGTFYRASSPDAEPYAKVGQEINPDAVLCIVEAMKVMNEIKAEVRGVIREILVENAHAVQFGQPLFKIEKL
ncbi:MAG: acetyl-CoA carboxylase biotin carboxyl carrier protein [Verrucomicrobia bacterium]|nr:acetyl-CoA carboxylase biotin carboxyl carrier protein [Verrucomicrobiota bacterium]MBU4290017.1 acetyl-CoA carboxylase biotin carboxyl carrier protein [Verrucomicrobiota bacterium]MBU4430083.1 acetyl-CoA carboxylase biotin carboxyl carrier protein [Verrucomicrobiota bacterium]MCG2679612.1 acetyl-CoA carboxylase biotin carboxyl carrier protein [Kiritimatiellia bacterium]